MRVTLERHWSIFEWSPWRAPRLTAVTFTDDSFPHHLKTSLSKEPWKSNNMIYFPLMHFNVFNSALEKFVLSSQSARERFSHRRAAAFLR